MLVKFEVLTAVTVKLVFFDMLLCSLVDIYQHFRGICCLHSRVRKWRQEVFTKLSYLSAKLQVDISKNSINLMLAYCVAVAGISADVVTF